jgi:hypothetical protein
MVANLTRYARSTKNPNARRMLGKLKGCGITPIGKGVSFVRHSLNGRVIGGAVQGVRTCKDRFCPVCSARIEGTEAQDTRAALLYLHHTGTLEKHRLVLFTATMGHRFHDDHTKNFHTLLVVIAKLQTQRWWKAGVAGSIVKLEIEGTIVDPARSGLHPHAHVLLALAEGADSDALAARVEGFFKSEFANSYPGETRIGWQRPKADTWWKSVEPANLPRYLAKKRWAIAEELTASGAKYGGFWRRPVEDLVAVWGLLEGVRTIRRTGIFKTALAAVKPLKVKPAAVTVAKMGNAEWSALTPEIREPLAAAIENPAADPEWIAWTVANLHNLTPAEAEILLLNLATVDDPADLPRQVNAASARVVVSGMGRRRTA